MKCTKCGHEVDPSSPNCPYCASGASRTRRKKLSRTRCPNCGSENVEESAEWYIAALHLSGFRGKVLELLLRTYLWIVGVNPYYENCLDCGSRWKTRSDLLPILVLAATAIVVTVIITAMVLAF
jgi:hypothetical protein